MPSMPPGRRTRIAVTAGGAAAAVLLALLMAGVVPRPDVEGALTDLSDSLGAWTYALVAGLAFLETGAFVGLVAPGETAISRHDAQWGPRTRMGPRLAVPCL